MTKPKISVILPVYNADRYIHESLDSTLGQSVSDFELIIIDDGSTDKSLTILRDYAEKDSRILLLENEHNIGLVNSLNRGLAIVRGEYIARMDADDVNLPNRFALQIQYLEQHSEVGVLGTNMKFIDDNGFFTNEGRPIYSQPVSPNMIKWMLHWNCGIYHSTVMVKRNVLDRTGFSYDPDFQHAEDRDLWIRLSKNTVIACLPEVLVYYRRIPSSISHFYYKEQKAIQYKITRREIVTLLGEDFNDETLETLVGVFTNHNQNMQADYFAAADMLLVVYQRFCNQQLSESDLEQIQADVAARLIKIADVSGSCFFRKKFMILCKLRGLPFKCLLSVKIIKQIIKVLKIY